MTSNNIVSNEWEIHWWAKIGKKVFGKDTITYHGELTDADADDILSHNAQADHNSKYPELQNFSDCYLNADMCENFGVVKVKRLKQSKEGC